MRSERELLIVFVPLFCRRSASSFTQLTFPKSRSALWDGSPAGEKLCLQLCSHRKPQIVLLEKALRLAQRHARHYEEGITVPCLFTPQSETTPDSVVQSEAELHHCFKVLQQFVSSRQTLDLSQLLKIRAQVVCSQRSDAAAFSLSWSAVCPAVGVDVQPVRPVPIIPTALLRSLTSIGRPAQHAGRQRGWLSGVTHIYNPQVWARSLRFMFGAALQDRVLSEIGCFLLVLFGSTHRAPQFFQCRESRPGSGPQLDFQLLTASQSVTLYQVRPLATRTLESRMTTFLPDRLRARILQLHRSDINPPSVPELSLLIDSSFSSNHSGGQDSGSAHRLPPANRNHAPPAPSWYGESPSPHPSHSPGDAVSPWLLRPPCGNHCCEKVGGVLTSDTYQLLLHQDHQLRLLQAQVQMLLEAQGKLQSSSQPVETQTSKTTASIAVETGASLFWGQNPDQPVLQEEQEPPPSSLKPNPSTRSPPSSSSSTSTSTHDLLEHKPEEGDLTPQAASCSSSDPHSVSEPTVSALFPGGSVDLSLEANAIALRYLSQSQLSRLSLGGHAPQSIPVPSSSSESLLSPSNMSLATRKYMRRYGLIEEDGEDEEEQEEVRGQEVLQPLTEALNTKLLPQSQLIRELRPKMQLLARNGKPDSEDKENCSDRRPPIVRTISQQPEGSVGNILDLSRLRQLPKLF
ncbi:hypothetical protein GOODEAATRI_020172 [Goodea atripinnis]|uniref:TAL1 n=1 Tax=Goodea atripinnis TaxID=208336 RepID=A0ABV0Q076_9TELE